MEKDNVLEEFNLNEIMYNIGIAELYIKKQIVFEGKLVTYFENCGIDLGFKTTKSNLFVSLKNFSGEFFSMGYEKNADNVAVNFTNLNDFKKDRYTLDSKNFSFPYYYDEDDEKFKKIKDKNLIKLINSNKKRAFDLDINEMYEEIKQTIISQDEQVMQILVSIYKNQKVINSSLSDEIIGKLKENIIVYGPTGTGKTEILKQIAKICKVPIVIEDATSFSETGYVGRDVSEMLRDLYVQADWDIETAQKGILVIDEFDKLGQGDMTGNGAGPSREGVQRSLLKVLDGGTVAFSEDGFESDMIDFDTTRLTVVALGAFDNIKKDDDYSDVTIKDFTEYGIMREIMGRFSKLISMNSFKYEDFKQIILKSTLSPINTYKELFETMKIEFTYDEDLVDYIINEAMALNLGARSLKTVFDGIISDKLFDVFASKPESLHLTKPEDNKNSFVTKQKLNKKKNHVGFC